MKERLGKGYEYKHFVIFHLYYVLLIINTFVNICAMQTLYKLRFIHIFVGTLFIWNVTYTFLGLLN